MAWTIHSWSPADGVGTIASPHFGPVPFDSTANVDQVDDFRIGEPVLVELDGDAPAFRALSWHALLMAFSEDVDVDKLAEVALALLSLTFFTDRGDARAWKGLDWDVLDLLYQRGWILDPKGKAKSVVFTDSGKSLAESAFTKHFSRTVGS